MSADPEADLLRCVQQLTVALDRLYQGGLRFVSAEGTVGAAQSPVQPAPAAETMGTGQGDPEREVAGSGVEPLAPTRRSLASVHEELGACTRCRLHETRQNIVFGVGSRQAALMFVGEGPGASEDAQGEPFVGRAGQLLDRMIAAMGWTRESVYITNIVKCRPPGNRDPRPDEVAACEPFLARQIEAIAPRMIVTLGKPAAHLLLRTQAPISALRGRFQSYREIPVMPTYHPAYLLRSPDKKAAAWSDLKAVITELERCGVVPPGRG